MNLNQVRFAQAVSESGSFSRAAERCHITQPSLSTAIAQLEQELGGRLFDRSTRRVTLTPFGAHLLPHLGGMLVAEREIRAAAATWLQPGRRLIRVGFSPAAQVRPVQLAGTTYAADHADVEIVFKECLHQDLAQRLVAGTLDLVLTAGLDRPVRNSVALTAEPLVVVPRPGRNLSATGVTLAELAGETFAFTGGCGLADAIRSLFRGARIPIREYPGQALSYRVLEEWADLGLGSTILPHSKVSRGTPSIPLLHARRRPVLLQTSAQWQRGAERDAPTRPFLAWLSQRTKSISEGSAS